MKLGPCAQNVGYICEESWLRLCLLGTGIFSIEKLGSRKKYQIVNIKQQCGVFPFLACLQQLENVLSTT